MTIQNPLLIIPVTFGIISIVAGFMMLKFPPKNINSFYGYRTSSSMKNQQRWNFAQIYSAKEMVRLGLLTTIFGLTGLIYHPKEVIATILGLGLIFIAIIALILRVELAIKKNFKENNKTHHNNGYKK